MRMKNTLQKLSYFSKYWVVVFYDVIGSFSLFYIKNTGRVLNNATINYSKFTKISLISLQTDKEKDLSSRRNQDNSNSVK